MITKQTMNFRADEAFALTEILEVAYETAFKACNEGGSDDQAVALERVKNILFIASNTSGDMAHELSRMISQCIDPEKEVAK